MERVTSFLRKLAEINFRAQAEQYELLSTGTIQPWN